MAVTPESRVKSKVDAIIQKYSNVIVNPITKGYGSSGVSDKVICINGRFVAIETKTLEAKGVKRIPTKLQFRFLCNVLTAGGYVAVINETNYAELDAMLRDLSRLGAHQTNAVLFNGCPHPTVGAEVKEIQL